jgi:hypothetical protein
LHPVHVNKQNNVIHLLVSVSEEDRETRDIVQTDVHAREPNFVALQVVMREKGRVVIGTKVLRVFLLAVPSPPLPPLSKRGLKLICNLNILD